MESLENNVDHISGTNGYTTVENNIDLKASGDTNHRDSSESKNKEHHSHSKSKDGHERSSSSHKHKDGHSSSSSKSKEGPSSKSSSDKHRDSSHSKDKHHSSSDKKHSSSEHKSQSSKSSSSSDKHRDSSSKSSSDKPRESSSKSSSSDRHKDGSHKSSSSDKHKDGSHKSSSSSDKHRESSHKSSSDKPKDRSSEKHSSSSSSKSSSKHKHDSSKSSSDKHRDDKKSSSSSDKHKEKSKDGSSKVPEKSGDREKESSEKKKHHPEKHSSSKSIKGQNGLDKSMKSEDEADFVSPVKIETDNKVEEPPMFDNESDSSKLEVDDVPQVKLEESSDDEPLSAQIENVKTIKEDENDFNDSSVKEKIKRKYEESSEDEDLSSRLDKIKKMKKEVKMEKIVSKKRKSTEEDDFVAPKKKKLKMKGKAKGDASIVKPTKGKKKAEEEQQVWKWWEEEKRDDGVKWTFLEHMGPMFAPQYDRLPKSVKFQYDGKEIALKAETEEVAGFYSKMLDHEYTTREVFNNNFFKDWRKVMTNEEKEIITDLKKCNFREMHTFYTQQNEDRKNRTKEQKQELKKHNENIVKEYGFCMIDGHKEKIGNFRIEPPGLFRGRGDHPKQGRLKKRVEAESVQINCSKDSKIPQPPEGHKWKEVRHDNAVTWLASWNENIQGATKYVMLNAASKLKGEKDWQKYEVARKLHKCVDKLRATYREDWKSKEMRVRQRSVALYFIDKLALRAGNEKEEGESADTVGCCSLRVQHIKLHDEKDNKECVVEFDFLGKDSIRYQNSVPVEKRAYKNLCLFMENKQPEDDLFDRLNTTLMNKHLSDLMEGLTAKVFRTYNASRTLQEQLDLLTNEEDPVTAKMLSYNRANRAVAILCNHQRAAPKSFDQSMENLRVKIDEKRKQVRDAKQDAKDAKSDCKNAKSERNRLLLDKKRKTQTRLEEQLTRLEVQATDKEENKEIALSTSKLNYLDPRISVAWCKKWDVPVEKVYNKTQRDKFRWAIDMATADFQF